MRPPNYEQVFIPIEKSLHFKTKSQKGEPEGQDTGNRGQQNAL